MAVTPGIESGYAWLRAGAALVLMTMGASGMYTTVVALKPVAAEFGTSRAAASLPYMLFALGFGLGGMVMGRLSDRLGVMRPVMMGGLMLGAGFWLAARADSIWLYSLAFGIPIGLLGTATTFAPLVADISLWFERRRGLAVGIVISGSYVAGVIWPPVVQAMIDSMGWRDAFEVLGLIVVVVTLPLALVMRPRPPAESDAGGGDPRRAIDARPLGMAPSTLQCLLCGAGIACCVAMAAPQVHIVALADDLGFAREDGARMLSLMLAGGIVSRLLSGWISDRIGGLRTLLLGSSLQGSALALFLPMDGLAGLYAASLVFGLVQGGIVPSYAMIIRRYFRARDAGWRIGVTLMFTLAGMALGGWMAGAAFDLTGSYDAAFVNAIVFNLINLAIVLTLVARARARPRIEAPALG